jgi:hypothetical protein
LEDANRGAAPRHHLDMEDRIGVIRHISLRMAVTDIVARAARRRKLETRANDAQIRG